MSLSESAMAVGTGFGQLFRGVGQVRSVTSVVEFFSNHHAVQVGGVAVSSAVFQSALDRELRNRIHGPGSDEVPQKSSCPTIYLKVFHPRS